MRAISPKSADRAVSILMKAILVAAPCVWGCDAHGETGKNGPETKSAHRPIGAKVVASRQYVSSLGFVLPAGLDAKALVTRLHAQTTPSRTGPLQFDDSSKPTAYFYDLNVPDAPLPDGYSLRLQIFTTSETNAMARRLLKLGRSKVVVVPTKGDSLEVARRLVGLISPARGDHVHLLTVGKIRRSALKKLRSVHSWVSVTNIKDPKEGAASVLQSALKDIVRTIQAEK